MALADPFIINDNAAVARSFFALPSTGEGVKRLDSFPTPPAYRALTVKHSKQGSSKTANLADRHLIQFVYSNNDANGIAQVATVNCTIVVPVSAAIVRADVDHLIALLKNTLVVATVDKILRGES